MKTFISLALLLLTCSNSLFSQDTTYTYFTKKWNESAKDTAFYYRQVYKQGDQWIRKDFLANDQILKSEGSFLDKEITKRHGTFKWYDDNGILSSTALYEKGKPQHADYFYATGKKKGHIEYLQDGTDEQQAWDENGKELQNYILEREARFPGGMFGWRRYLERNLNANVAADANAKKGIYTVKVQFIVDKEGNISDVKAIDVPAACKPCGKEAIKIIELGPKWEPAIQDNHPVIYQALQYISWQVSEE